MAKLKLAMSIIGGIAVLAFILSVWWGFNEIKTLRAANHDLNIYTTQLAAIIDTERERSNKIEQSAIRLEEKDNDRSRQMQRFASSLNNLAKENETYRDILNTIIPDDLVQGLKAFAR